MVLYIFQGLHGCISGNEIHQGRLLIVVKWSTCKYTLMIVGMYISSYISIIINIYTIMIVSRLCLHQ